MTDDQNGTRPPPVRFSWVPLYEAARPEGYRVVIELPAKGRIRIEPDDGDPVSIAFKLNAAFGRGAIEEVSEEEIMKVPRPVRPAR